MRSRRLFTVVAVTALALVLTAAPAYALHTVYQGSDYAETTGDHTGIWACDREADGHGVWADWYDYGLTYYAGLVDANGSQPGCTFKDIYPKKIMKFRVCERYVACSGWMYTT